MWDEAEESPISLKTVRAVLPLVEAKLDGSFFRVRIERATPHELRYLRAMAELGEGPCKASDVAAVLGRASEQLGPTRSRLIDKGLLYTPGYGLAAFTVPQFVPKMMPAVAANTLSKPSRMAAWVEVV